MSKAGAFVEDARMLSKLLLLFSAGSASTAVLSPPAFATAKSALIATLREEYGTMFAPMRKEFYVGDVSFKDPMISISGINAYQSNVDLLGGRNPLGAFLFKDASIELHDVVEDPNDQFKLTTRWTLQLCMKVLPWQPYARFTGVSQYQLNERCLVVAQQDYWDSINLSDGSYRTRSPLEALADFAAQLSVAAGPKTLPYTLLRRGARYDVRRYSGTPPQRLVAAGGAAGLPPSTVVVAALPSGASASAANEAAAAARRLSESDGLTTESGYWRAYGSADEVWIALKNEARSLWPKGEAAQ